MRAVFNSRRESALLYENGAFLGAKFSSEGWCEHNSGVWALRRAFNCKATEAGIEGRRVQQVEHLVYDTLPSNDSKAGDLMFGEAPPRKGEIHNPREIAKWLRGSEAFTPWVKTLETRFAYSDAEFGIMAFTPEAKHSLSELNAAFQARDVAIIDVANFTRQERGLYLAIISRMDAKLVQTLEDFDYGKWELEDLMFRTRIESKLRAAGKKYFALIPDWVNREAKCIRFWLNPMDQQHYRAGLYTEEELLLWIEDKGPVVIR